MAKNSSARFYFRVIHRYLGFFLAGIMAMYALSGIVLIYRDTDAFKQEKHFNKQIAADVSPEALGAALGINRLKVDKQEGVIYHFKNGTYNSETGIADYSIIELPMLLNKMTHLHKAETGDPLYFLNICFGISLLFFVISSFWMFMPGTEVFKKGLYFALAGVALTLVLLFV